MFTNLAKALDNITRYKLLSSEASVVATIATVETLVGLTPSVPDLIAEPNFVEDLIETLGRLFELVSYHRSL